MNRVVQCPTCGNKDITKIVDLMGAIRPDKQSVVEIDSRDRFVCMLCKTYFAKYKTRNDPRTFDEEVKKKREELKGEMSGQKCEKCGAYTYKTNMDNIAVCRICLTVHEI